MELKNTAQELWDSYTSFNSWINQAEERISEIEDQLNEIRWEGKIREKKLNVQSLQELWDYMKRLNLCLIGVPECDRENKTKLENTPGYYPGEFPQLRKAGQHSNTGNTENTTKVFLEKSNPKAHNCQIHQGWNKGKSANVSQSVIHKGKPIRLTADLLAETLPARRSNKFKS